jgi:cell division protein FtsX
MGTTAMPPKRDLGSLRIHDRQRSQGKTGKRFGFFSAIVGGLVIVAGLLAAFRTRKPLVEVAAARPAGDLRAEALLNASGYVTPRRRAIMGLGAVCGALNTMYSAVAERGREIATMRALGFGGGSVVLSFIIESLLISLVGGLIGCIAVLPLNGLTTGTINWQTFSHLAFAFKITTPLLAAGVIFALIMGFLGGVFPALRAARRPVAAALRSL